MPAQTAPASTVPPGSATRGSASLTGALILLATVQLMVVLDMTIVNVALPSIDRALRFNLGNISWIVNGYELPFGALLLFKRFNSVDDLTGEREAYSAFTRLAWTLIISVAVATIIRIIPISVTPAGARRRAKRRWKFCSPANLSMPRLR